MGHPGNGQDKPRPDEGVAEKAGGGWKRIGRAVSTQRKIRAHSKVEALGKDLSFVPLRPDARGRSPLTDTWRGRASGITAQRSSLPLLGARPAPPAPARSRG